jgi:hypothetical protein
MMQINCQKDLQTGIETPHRNTAKKWLRNNPELQARPQQAFLGHFSLRTRQNASFKLNNN